MRRNDLLTNLKMEKDKLSRIVDHASTTTTKSIPGIQVDNNNVRKELLNLSTQSSSYKSHRKFGAIPRETEVTRALDNDGLLQLQNTTMQVQDKSLDLLSGILRKQRNMAEEIGNELVSYIFFVFKLFCLIRIIIIKFLMKLTRHIIKLRLA